MSGRTCADCGTSIAERHGNAKRCTRCAARAYENAISLRGRRYAAALIRKRGELAAELTEMLGVPFTAMRHRRALSIEVDDAVLLAELMRRVDAKLGGIEQTLDLLTASLRSGSAAGGAETAAGG